jgi:DNA-binding CsgD family transcriptional regulator
MGAGQPADAGPAGGYRPVFPPPWPERLRAAASDGGVGKIDRITGEMHMGGLVRHPGDGSRFGSVSARDVTKGKAAGRAHNPWGLVASEARVMDAVVAHFTQDCVARALGLTRNTVSTHLDAVRTKMECNTTLQAALIWDRYRRGAVLGDRELAN